MASMNRFFEFSQSQIKMLSVLAVLLVLSGSYLFVRNFYLRPAEPARSWQIEAFTGYTPPFVIDINHAPLDSLELIPGIGPVLARRIESWRREHGPFPAVESLGVVPGIGPDRLRKVKPYITVTTP